MKPPTVAIVTNKIPSLVIFALNIVNPKTVIGTLFSEPTMAYVVADVAPTHHKEAKFK